LIRRARFRLGEGRTRHPAGRRKEKVGGSSAEVESPWGVEGRGSKQVTCSGFLRRDSWLPRTHKEEKKSGRMI